MNNHGAEVAQLKKNSHGFYDLIYVHLNESSQYVISYGIEFAEFARSLPRPLNNLLLLKHRFNEGEFNRHTLLEYVPQENLAKLVHDNIFAYGAFCWVDFEEYEGLNVLTGQEIAELLFLGHRKQHLKLPFYSKLGNRYVYLSHDDGWFTKTYFRQITDFYKILSNVITLKLEGLKLEKTILGLRKKRTAVAPINYEIIQSLTKFMREGTVISLRNLMQNRTRIEIPIWVIGDFDSMDDMFEEYKQMNRSICDAKLIYDKKMKEWTLVAQ